MIYFLAELFSDFYSNKDFTERFFLLDYKWKSLLLFIYFYIRMGYLFTIYYVYGKRESFKSYFR